MNINKIRFTKWPNSTVKSVIHICKKGDYIIFIRVLINDLWRNSSISYIYIKRFKIKSHENNFFVPMSRPIILIPFRLEKVVDSATFSYVLQLIGFKKCDNCIELYITICMILYNVEYQIFYNPCPIIFIRFVAFAQKIIRYTRHIWLNTGNAFVSVYCHHKCLRGL